MQGEQSESILQNLWDKSRKHTVVYLAEGRLCVTYAPPSFLPSLPPSLDLRFVNVDLCHSLVYLIPYCLFGIERQTERDAALKLGAKVRLVLHSWPSFVSELRMYLALSRKFLKSGFLASPTRSDTN